MRHLLTFLFCSLVALFVTSCANDYSKEDYSKEAEYLKQVYDVDSVTVIKAKEIKAYNPMLDDDKERVYHWSAITHQRLIDAMKSKSDDIFDIFVEIFENPNANSDAMVVEFDKGGKTLSTIIFSINGEYYQWYLPVAEYAINAVREHKEREADERLTNSLNDMLNAAH